MSSQFLYPTRLKDLFPPRVSIVALGAIHLVGLIGFGIAPAAFQRLIPLHLLLCASVWALNQKTWTIGFATWIGACGVLGFVAEVLGVRTALIFGSYRYGPTLGPGVGGVPLLMAVNWSLLLAVVGEVSAIWGDARGWRPVSRAALGAALLVGLDSIMEPFAVSHGLWSWEDQRVPLHNYLGWAALSFAMLLPYHAFELRRKNESSVWLYLYQCAFFCGLLIFARGTQ